jgi:hypothetical protein
MKNNNFLLLTLVLLLLLGLVNVSSAETTSVVTLVYFTVNDITSPIIVINYPWNMTKTTKITPVWNVTVYDDLSPILTCEIWIEDVLVANDTAVPNGVPHEIPTVALVPGVYNTTVTCYDSGHNYGYSPNLWLYVYYPWQYIGAVGAIGWLIYRRRYGGAG